jgi:hypothetical protein
MHDLRHAHASWLLAGGSDLKSVMERMGHAQIQTTHNDASGPLVCCSSWSGRRDEILQQCAHPIRVAQLWHVPAR